LILRKSSSKAAIALAEEWGLLLDMIGDVADGEMDVDEC
jgi:hypothetical protein